MAQAAEPNVVQARTDKLKRLAEDDCEDEGIIAEARKRIKLREIERMSIQSGTGTEGSPHTATDNGDDAGGLMKVKDEVVAEEAFQLPGTLHAHLNALRIDEIPDFDDMLQLVEELQEEGTSVVDALSCPACLAYPPDDPVLTSCLCLYCMECLTEMLGRARSKSLANSLACLGYDEVIEGYVTLSQHQFEQLLQVRDVREEAPTDPGWPGPRDRPDDLELLWHSHETSARPVELPGEHSRSSPELGINSNGVNDALSSDDDNSINDGFSDKPNRSDGYEIDVEAECDPSFVTSDCGNPVDPRHVVLSTEWDDSNDEGKACLNEIGSSEIEELLQPAGEASKFPAPADEQQEEEHERRAEEGEDEAPLLIDLTEAGDIIEREIANASDDASSKSGGSGDSSDGPMDCSCPTCMHS
jgi:hypothetical protein